MASTHTPRFIDSEPSLSQRVPAAILVVEDEHLVALDIQSQLERMGHTAAVVHSGRDALEKAQQMSFDLVLMDIKLGGELDGIDAAKQLRASQDIPIIYLTAYADDHMLDRARATEPYGYVVKPFHERELKAVIEMTLQRHRSDRQRLHEQQVQQFLANASARFARTLDYRTMAREAVELIGPRYAEWCAIHFSATNDVIPEFDYTSPEGARVHRETSRLIEDVLRTRQSRIMTQDLDQPAGTGSLICVPLLARERVLGVLVLCSGHARPRYSISDITFVEDFAYRLGMALDSALLYRTAERAIGTRDDVLGIVSHDLRAPLGVISVGAEILADNDATAKIGARIARSANRMNRLIADLVDASVIHAGSLSLDIKTYSAAELVGETIEMFRSQAEARAITLTDEGLSGSPNVRCDRDRILQVLSNLVDNALKFTARGGTITIRLEHHESHVRFEVQDTGTGIAPEHVPRLFDRFWRGQTRGRGAGLGLFIAYGIIAAHGGALRVETTVGLGSRFFFELPEASSKRNADCEA